MAVVFFTIFNSYNGILNQFLIRSGLSDSGVDWLGPKYAMLTVILVAAWGAVGNYMLLFLAGLQNIPEDVYEASSWTEQADSSSSAMSPCRCSGLSCRWSLCWRSLQL